MPFVNSNITISITAKKMREDKKMENKTLMTDFYELTMAQTYFDQGEKDKKAYFDVFFRESPFQGGYAIAGGLDGLVEYIKNFYISEEDIAYLRSLGNFREDFLS